MKNQELQDTVKEITSKSLDINSDQSRVALALRKAVKEHNTDVPWPPLPSELRDASYYVPNCLSRFLKILLTGSKQEGEWSNKVLRIVEPVGQDIIYAISLGKQKNCKTYFTSICCKVFNWLCRTCQNSK